MQETVSSPISLEDNVFLQTLRIPIRASRVLLGSILACHLGALLLLPAADLPRWLAALLGAAVIASLAHALHRHLAHADPEAPREWLLNAEGEWWLIDNGGRVWPARLRPDACIHPVLSVLVFRVRDRTFPLLLTRDNIDPDTFRRLRVRLRLPVTRE
jgi:hypothetical protein